MTVGREHALIIEGLNAIKLLEDGSRAEAAGRVAAVVTDVDVDAVAEAAESVGARHTAAPLLAALGGGSPSGPPPPGYEQWVQRGARNSGRDLVIDILRRAPGQAPRVVWEQLTLDPYVARFWAHTHGVPYRKPAADPVAAGPAGGPATRLRPRRERQIVYSTPWVPEIIPAPTVLPVAGSMRMKDPVARWVA